MSSSNNSQNASSDDTPSEHNIDEGLTPSGNGIAPDSTSSSLSDTHNQQHQGTSNSNAQANPTGSSTAAAVLSSNTANNPPIRHRWAQTVGTAIFSYDPITRQLVPIGGTAPVTTWQSTNPLADNNGSAAGLGGAGAGRNPANGADPPGDESLFPEEGTSMSTHLSFSTPDGRPIPISVMRQLLVGMPGALPASMNELLNQNSAANPNQQQPQPQPFQAPPQTQQAFRQWQQAAPLAEQFPDMDTADGIPRALLGQPPPQRARTSSEPLFPSAAPAPNAVPPSPSIGLAFLPVNTLPVQQGPHHHHHHPIYWNPNLMPTAVPTVADDGVTTAPANQAGNQPNPDGQPTGDEPGRSAFVTLWDPIRGRMFTTTTPMPDMGAQPPITGHGVGWTVPVAGPDGNMTTRFVGWGAGTVHGLGMPGLDPERPPDTRRAKELLRGLNLVPRGLVRRMERVEKMLGEEGAEGGRLVCAVCYDPLLGPVPEQPPVPLHTEDETDVAMDGHAPPGDGIDANSDPKPKSSQENPEDSTAKTKQKTKPKHPSLEHNALIALPCTHVFHAVDCLLPWFEQGKTTCPTCRFDVDPHSETLNIGRWLGGAARRRRAAAAANATSGSATAAPNSSTEPAAPAAGAAVPMDAEEEDDETDAFAVEDEGVPGDLDPNQLFREAIGRAVATALSQALMNQTPPQHQMTLPPGSLPTNGSPTTSDTIMADGAFGPTRSEPPTSQAEWTRRFDTTVVDQMGMMGGMHLLSPGIELPGANRDQDGRMFRDDGESSVAATADSSSESDSGDDPLVHERVGFGLPRRARAQAPSPSPPLVVNPEASGGRTLRSSSRLNATSSTTTSDRSTALDRFREDLMALDTPNAGPSHSGPAASSTSRPSTPFRHHPYANARPAFSFNPRPTPLAATQGPVQNAPGPNGTPAEHIPAGVHAGPPVLIGPHGEMIYQRTDGPGRVSITRHSITFNLALPPPEHPTQPATADPANLMGANQPQPQQQQQQRADAASRIPEFLNNVFTRTGIFGPPPATATGTANGTRTERPPPRLRRKWVAPEGTSLRSVIESKERQVGLRCDDVSCLWAPEDGDDETTEVTIHPDRTYLRKTTSDVAASCMHRYHPECLLVASRVAEAGLDREIDAVGDGEWLEVACPFCRVHGGQEKSEWKMYRDLADYAQ